MADVQGLLYIHALLALCDITVNQFCVAVRVVEVLTAMYNLHSVSLYLVMGALSTSAMVTCRYCIIVLHHPFTSSMSASCPVSLCFSSKLYNAFDTTAVVYLRLV